MRVFESNQKTTYYYNLGMVSVIFPAKIMIDGATAKVVVKKDTGLKPLKSVYRLVFPDVGLLLKLFEIFRKFVSPLGLVTSFWFV